jgi:transposase InsO family protein
MLSYWAHILLDYDFEVVHCPGLLMILEDSLSRLYQSSFWREDDEAHEYASNNNQKHLPLRVNALVVDEGPVGANKQLAGFIKERLNKQDPNSDEAKRSILLQAHEFGHFGADSMFQQIWTSGYYWPGLLDDCRRIAGECERCLQFNVSRAGFHPLNPIAATFPFDHLSLDLLGPLPEAEDKYCYVLIIVDIATRFVILRALIDKSASSVARALYHVLTDFGIPKIIQSDNGTEFINSTIDLLMDQLGIEHRRISPYHPRANGAAESHVKLTKNLLFKIAHGDLNHWNQYLPSVQLSLNLRIPKRHRSMPFCLMFGRAFNHANSTSNQPQAPISEADLMRHHHQIQTIIFPAIRQLTERYNQRMATQHDKHTHLIDKNKLQPGTLVMVLNPSSTTGEPSYSGPCKILRTTRGGSYQLQDQAGNLLYMMFLQVRSKLPNMHLGQMRNLMRLKQ